jgi:hypothetical protein
LGRGLIALDVESIGVTEAANARHEDSLPCVALRRARAATAGAPAAISPLSRSWATMWQAAGKERRNARKSGATVIVFITA